MPEDQGQSQGDAGQSQGDEGKQGQGEEFDKERAMATIKAQRDSEAAAIKEAAAARAELKKMQDEQKAKTDADLSETERLQKKLTDLEAAREADTAATRNRVAKASLKAAAAAAGALYPDDASKLVALDGVKFDDDGEPQNAEELVEALKKSRPALFAERRPGSGDGGPRGTAESQGLSMDDRIRSVAGK